MGERIDAHLRNWAEKGWPSLETLVKSMIEVTQDPYKTRMGVEHVVMPLVRLIGNGNAVGSADHPPCDRIDEKVKMDGKRFTLFCNLLTMEQQAHVKWVLLNPPAVCRTSKGVPLYSIRVITYYSTTASSSPAAPLAAPQVPKGAGLRPPSPELLPAPRRLGGFTSGRGSAGAAAGAGFSFSFRKASGLVPREKRTPEEERKMIVWRWIQKCFVNEGFHKGEFVYKYSGERGFGVAKSGSAPPPLEQFLEKVIVYDKENPPFSKFCEEYARVHELPLGLDRGLSSEELEKKLRDPLSQLNYTLKIVV